MTTVDAGRRRPWAAFSSAARRWPALADAPASVLMSAVFVVVGTLIRIRQLGHTLFEFHAFRQTQTAFAVREYARHGIDLLQSPLPIFGPHASVPMEFPLFQGIAALLVPLGLSPATASRLESLVFFQVTAVLLAILLWRWFGPSTAAIATALFEFLPFGLFWGAASLIEFFATAFALGMVLGFDLWLTRRSTVALVLGSLCAIVAFLVKVTTAPLWGFVMLASLIALIAQRGWAPVWRRALGGILAGPALGLVAAVLWSRYADAVKEKNPLADAWTSSNLTTWNFGTIRQRVDPSVWTTILDRWAELIAGPACIGLIVATLAAVLMRDRAQRWRTLGFLVCGVAGPFVFVNLYWIHEYYAAAVYPALVAAVAIGATWLARALARRTWQRRSLQALSAALVLVLTLVTPLGTQRYWDLRNVNGVPDAAVAIDAHTARSDLIVMTGCGMDPTYLYFADRRGLSMTSPDQSAAVWRFADIRDYHYAYNCDTAHSPTQYLPAGYTVEPLGAEMYRIVPPR